MKTIGGSATHPTGLLRVLEELRSGGWEVGFANVFEGGPDLVKQFLIFDEGLAFRAVVEGDEAYC